MTNALPDAGVDATELLERARDDQQCQIAMVGCVLAFNRLWQFPWSKPKECSRKAVKMLTVSCACTNMTLAACEEHYRKMHGQHVACSNCHTQIRLGIDASI